jgi:hypothetical protein
VPDGASSFPSPGGTGPGLSLRTLIHKTYNSGFLGFWGDPDCPRTAGGCVPPSKADPRRSLHPAASPRVRFAPWRFLFVACLKFLSLFHTRNFWSFIL